MTPILDQEWLNKSFQNVLVAQIKKLDVVFPPSKRTIYVQDRDLDAVLIQSKALSAVQERDLDAILIQGESTIRSPTKT